MAESNIEFNLTKRKILYLQSFIHAMYLVKVSSALVIQYRWKKRRRNIRALQDSVFQENKFRLRATFKKFKERIHQRVYYRRLRRAKFNQRFILLELPEDKDFVENKLPKL